MRYSPAYEAPFEVLLNTFNHGYDGYLLPLRLTADQLRGHIEQNGIDLAHSVIAWAADDQPVGAGLLGQRGEKGWIGGMGVIPAFRGRGIGRGLLEAMLRSARSLGMTQVQLEVLHGNLPAMGLYHRLGFAPKRRLLIVEALHIPPGAGGYHTRQVPLEDALRCYAAFKRVPNPWQRDLPGLRHLPPTIPAYLAEADGETAAYAIASGGDHGVSLVDIAFAEGKPEALRAVLAHLAAHYPDVPLRLANIGEDEPAWDVLKALDFRERLSQVEMSLTLEGA